MSPRLRVLEARVGPYDRRKAAGTFMHVRPKSNTALATAERLKVAQGHGGRPALIDQPRNLCFILGFGKRTGAVNQQSIAPKQLQGSIKNPALPRCTMFNLIDRQR